MEYWPTLIAALMTPAATVWGVDMTWLEVVAVVLSVLMVWLNLRVNPWAWPLAIVASALYAVLFAQYGLYGEASLQFVFIAMSLWGWWQWLWGRDEQQQALEVRQAPWRQLGGGLLAWGVLWVGIGLFLDHLTDSSVPYWDALPTAGSLVGQWWLARKWVANWPVWLVVNVISVGLFAAKAMWLTAVLYALFAVLSIWGWKAWLRLCRHRRDVLSPSVVGG